ncbi:MAG: hypothetical protein EXQ60_05440 [Candidatus Nanopelagicales bacterium]|nr:hypothetical protein [Candidatus Nanopelagicales bacterium]
MTKVQPTGANFLETVAGEGITFVDFWAQWCGPCHMFAPAFEAAALSYLDIKFGKVDTEVELELAGLAQISSIPTLMACCSNAKQVAA